MTIRKKVILSIGFGLSVGMILHYLHQHQFYLLEQDFIDINPAIKYGVMSFAGTRLSLRIFYPSNTVVYKLYRWGRVVYIGVTHKNRIQTRIEEHKRSGKKFTKFKHGRAMSRRYALRMEYDLIKKYRPKYNIKYNTTH